VFTNLFSEQNYILWAEGLTILAVVIVVVYVLYSLNVFKKD
jgi:hypothetical protein